MSGVTAKVNPKIYFLKIQSHLKVRINRKYLPLSRILPTSSGQ